MRTPYQGRTAGKTSRHLQNQIHRKALQKTANQEERRRRKKGELELKGTSSESSDETISAPFEVVEDFLHSSRNVLRHAVHFCKSIGYQFRVSRWNLGFARWEGKWEEIEEREEEWNYGFEKERFEKGERVRFAEPN